MPNDEGDLRTHFVRSIGESTRHNALAYGYSLALTGSFGVLALAVSPSVVDVFLFGIAGTLPFTIANPLVTRGFTHRVEGEPPIVRSLGSAFGFVSVAGAIGCAELAALLLSSWVAWFVGAFAASGGYLVLTSLELVAARRLRRVINREERRER